MPSILILILILIVIENMGGERPQNAQREGVSEILSCPPF